MKSYFDTFRQSFGEFAYYVWNEITFQVDPPHINYFYLLVLLSLIVWLLELVFPWRKNQSAFRQDFWLDTFYMFFNFYLFKIVVFAAMCNTTSQFMESIFGPNSKSLSLIHLEDYSPIAQLVIFFLITDFVQWATHILLHRIPVLWNFHKVHHSVQEMGFAAHLRYHWMENVIYTPVKYIAVAIIGGFSVEQVYLVYYIAIAVGHLNHANVKLTYGPLKYIFNNPVMHLWHHAKDLPPNRRLGANFAISLSLWDYLFKTAYVPSTNGNIPLGFADVEKFPTSFWHQIIYPLKKKGKND